MANIRKLTCIVCPRGCDMTVSLSDKGEVLEVVGNAVLDELALDAVAGTAHAGAVGAAALDHEARNHTVEDLAVIEALVDQADEVIDGVGSNLGIQLGLDHAGLSAEGITHLNLKSNNRYNP